MPQAPDLYPPLDANTEVGPIGFDFGPWLKSGTTIVDVVSITCVVVDGTDASPASRIIGSWSIVTSERTGLPSAQVNQFFGRMLDGVTYRLTCIAKFSDGAEQPLWVHAPCQAPS